MRVGLQLPEALLDKSFSGCLCVCGERGKFRGMKTVAAHFDGKQIVLEEPVELTAHSKLQVIVAEEGENFSEPVFAKVWDNARDGGLDVPHRNQVLRELDDSEGW